MVKGTDSSMPIGPNIHPQNIKEKNTTNVDNPNLRDFPGSIPNDIQEIAPTLPFFQVCYNSKTAANYYCKINYFYFGVFFQGP